MSQETESWIEVDSRNAYAANDGCFFKTDYSRRRSSIDTNAREHPRAPHACSSDWAEAGYRHDDGRKRCSGPTHSSYLQASLYLPLFDDAQQACSSGGAEAGSRHDDGRKRCTRPTHSSQATRDPRYLDDARNAWSSGCMYAGGSCGMHAWRQQSTYQSTYG